MDRDTEAGALSPKETGERWRLSFQRLTAADMPASYWRVAGAVWALTASYQKAWDHTFANIIATEARVHERTARQVLRELAEIGVVQWEPSGYGRARSYVGLPELFDANGWSVSDTSPFTLGTGLAQHEYQGTTGPITSPTREHRAAVRQGESGHVGTESGPRGV